MKTKITSNVLEDISKRLRGDIQSTNKALVVFTGSNIGLDKRLEELRKFREKGIQLSVAFSFMAESLLDTNMIINFLNPANVYREKDIFKLQDIIRGYSFIIGPNITVNTLSKITLGLIDSFVPNLIWTYLYKGRKVYLNFTSVTEYLGEETSNKEIGNILKKHIETVKKMGAIEIKDNKYLDIIIEGDGKTESKELIRQDFIEQNDSKSIITESDILAMSPNNKLTLAKGSIITPLARDKAREKNIKIEIKGG